MTYVYSQDGATIDRRHRDLPRQHWVQDTADTGHYEELDAGNAASHGYYPLTLTERPDADHVRTLERVGAGFETVWTFDQTLADSNADEADRGIDRAELSADLVKLRAIIQDLDGVGNQGVRIAKLEIAVKQLARTMARKLRADRDDD